MTQPPEYPGTPDPNQGPDDAGSSGETPSWENGGNQPPSYDQPSYEQPSYDQPQYGQQPGYGQDPSAYGQPSYQGTPYGAWQGGNDANRGTDGVSIAAFVLNLTPCGLVIPGWICAVIGLGRTKRNGTKGRWMAITSLVMGVLWAILFAALVFGGVWLFKNAVTEDRAEAGMCVDVDADGENVSLFKKDCSEDHNGEIIATHELTADEADNWEEAGERVCKTEIGTLAQRHPDLTTDWRHRAVRFTEDPEEGDKIACVVELKDGETSKRLTP